MRLSPSDPDIETIVGRITSGDLDLQPDFQRGEVWPLQKRRKLIDSIIRNWHIPPIHVVVTSNGKQEVLDGQQRLVSIRDFVRGEFAIDGQIEPLDIAVERLDGKLYSQLPEDVRRRFNQFTIRVFSLTDYNPEEPGELFFRLNQITSLTSAEQRNAFFGPVRNQVKILVRRLEKTKTPPKLGFSNRRMAYDDVVAKFLCTLEAHSLTIKIGASDISSRFRSDYPIPDRQFEIAERCITLFSSMIQRADIPLRFNKATLFSWLVFLYYFARREFRGSTVEHLSHFLETFEMARSENKAPHASTNSLFQNKIKDKTWEALLAIYTGRASFRVSDVSSVVTRDLILWLSYFYFAEHSGGKSPLPVAKTKMITEALEKLEKRQIHLHSYFFYEEIIDVKAWGAL